MTTTDRLLDVRTLDDPRPRATDEPTHLRAVQLGVSSGAFYPHIPTEEVPLVARTLGATQVELMLQTAGEYDAAFIRGVASTARAAGVRVHAVHTMHGLHPMLDAYPRRAAEGRSRFSQGIAAAAELGAGVLVWHGASRKQIATDADWERFLALTRDLAAECGAAGVTLAIENVSHGVLASVRDVVTFATRLTDLGSQDQIGFVFDPFQAAEAGANPFMMLAAMGNRIVNVHISDYLERNSRARHLVPGDGDLPWPALLRAIAGSGYRGPLMIEGPLDRDGIAIDRVRERFEPLIRSVFPFDPDGGASVADRGAGDEIATIGVASPPPGVLKGIELFNARRFFEQHEEIEHEWHAERGPVRRLYQGILQIGVGFHHALNGNYRGAIALLSEGIAKTSDFLPHALGIDTAALVTHAQRCLDHIVALGPERLDAFDAASIPTITVHSA